MTFTLLAVSHHSMKQQHWRCMSRARKMSSVNLTLNSTPTYEFEKDHMFSLRVNLTLYILLSVQVLVAVLRCLADRSVGYAAQDTIRPSRLT